MKIFLNNKFVNLEDAKISVVDRGFLYGEGAFETLRSFNGKIPFVKEHYIRLKKTLKFLNIKFNLTLQQLKKILLKLLKINNLSNSYIRITVSAGSLPLPTKHSPYTQKKKSYSKNLIQLHKPTIFILVRNLESIPEKFYKEGVSLTISKYRRNTFSLLPFYKTLSYLENIMEKRAANKLNFFDALFLDASGNYITECATSNIFIVKNGVVYTPPLQTMPILPGVTRKIIIKLAKNNKIKIIEKKITKYELFTAEEVFITNSLIGILPVKRVCNRIIGNGSVGKLTKLLIENYNQLTN